MPDEKDTKRKMEKNRQNVFGPSNMFVFHENTTTVTGQFYLRPREPSLLKQ